MRKYFVRIPDWTTHLYPKAIWKSESGRIEWTIDDGPDPVSTTLWLGLLDELNIRATFFVTGKKAEQYPELLDAITSEGHRLGSHGYDHLDGWRTSTDVYLQDFKKSMSVISTGLYRPPYGRMTLNQYKAIASQCDIMMWSLMPGDFDKATTAEDVENRLSKVKKGDIVVLHDHPQCVHKVAPALRRIVNRRSVHQVNR